LFPPDLSFWLRSLCFLARKATPSLKQYNKMVYAYLHKKITPFWREMGLENGERQVVLYLGMSSSW
jgi:hypothetical protein